MRAVTAPCLAPRATGVRAGAARATRASSTRTRASSASTPATSEMPSQLYDPAARAATYGGNHARYLLDLDANAFTTFNFCGGMMFGVSLSPRLREHLEEVASAGEADPRQPVVYGKEVRRMSMRPEGHDLDARADNARLFHGREVRQAENAAGGGGMLIHLSFAGEPGDDAEGGRTRRRMSTRDGSATGIADGATARSFKARASRPSAPGSAPRRSRCTTSSTCTSMRRTTSGSVPRTGARGSRRHPRRRRATSGRARATRLPSSASDSRASRRRASPRDASEFRKEYLF